MIGICIMHLLYLRDFLQIAAKNMDGAQVNESGLPGVPLQANTTNSTSLAAILTCSADFYLDPATELCRPICGQWKPYLDGLVIVMNILGLVTGLAVGIVAILLSVLKYRQRYTMYKHQ